MHRFVPLVIAMALDVWFGPSPMIHFVTHFMMQMHRMIHLLFPEARQLILPT
jgi:hypothetical protein